MMDLESAIQHCKEQVQEQAKKGCYSCAEEHQQLAEWLKELKAYREQGGDAISRQAVIDAMYELCSTGETLKENPWRDNPHIDAITDAIENLPSVSPQQVLDKIRAEIELKEKTLTDKYGQQKYGVWTDDVLQIIDKYKAESEDKECR